MCLIVALLLLARQGEARRLAKGRGPDGKGGFVVRRLVSEVGDEQILLTDTPKRDRSTGWRAAFFLVFEWRMDASASTRDDDKGRVGTCDVQASSGTRRSWNGKCDANDGALIHNRTRTCRPSSRSCNLSRRAR